MLTDRLTKSANLLHQEGLALCEKADYEATASLFARALGQFETSELWNDWATTQVACGQPAEAEQGYCRALELDPRNAQAMMNLGLLLAAMERYSEALPLLQHCLPAMEEPTQVMLSKIVSECREQQACRAQLALADLEAYLRSYVDEGAEGYQYFNNHLSRYLVTLEVLPQARPGQCLLELGALYHHLTPALQKWKGYQVRCTDLWEGPPRVVRRLTSRSGHEEHLVTVDNFDVHNAPWPYPNGSFDVILFCELLEHLSTDPMQVLAEINRLLKDDGLLLLTTPNIASARSVDAILRGESPYFWGQYEIGGRPTDRHNREYTPGEVVRLTGAAGFEPLTMRTCGGLGSASRCVLRSLVAAGRSIAWRGEDIVLLARKQGAVRDRYPAEFYARRISPDAVAWKGNGSPDKHASVRFQSVPPPILVGGLPSPTHCSTRDQAPGADAREQVGAHLGGHQGTTHVDEGVLDYLIRAFRIRSMLDLGCGPGAMIKLAKAKGLRALGVDGDPSVRVLSGLEPCDLIIHDFTQGPLEIAEEFDLAWSVEFLEHVEERFQMHYMRLLQQARFVFCTAAPPGKPGHHHVNCQDQEYWKRVFRKYGFVYDPKITSDLRRASTMEREFARETGMFYVRSGHGTANHTDITDADVLPPHLGRNKM